jgi:protease I
VGFLAQAEVEELHLWVPWYRLQEEGATCLVIADDEPKTYLGAHGLTVAVDEASWAVDPDAFAGFVIPGGFAPDYVRRTPSTRSIVRYGYLRGKVVAAIERGAWVLISAGILKDRAVAAPPALWDDLRNAGARVTDEDVVVDGNLITGRDTAALPAFCRALVAALVKAAAAPPARRQRGPRAPRGGTGPWRG